MAPALCNNQVVAGLITAVQELEDHDKEVDDVEVKVNGRHDIVVGAQSVVDHIRVCCSVVTNHQQCPSLASG